MAISRRDEQRVPTLIAVDSATGLIPTPLEVDSSSGELLVKPSLPSGAATEDKQDDIITKLTTPTGIEGSPVTVGTTAVELTFTGTTRVISIKADSGNTGKIWFGPASVDNSGNNAYGELTADSAVEIELNDVSAALYVVSDTASQKVYKAALT